MKNKDPTGRSYRQGFL